MTTQDALYAAVMANPADNLPRRLYADCLEETGDKARADFINLQCNLAELKPRECRFECKGEGPPGPIWCTGCGHDPKCCNCDFGEQRWELVKAEKRMWADVVRQLEDEIAPWFRLVARSKAWRTENHSMSGDWPFQAIIRRGFPDEIVCDVPTWLAVGRCSSCEGRGWHSDGRLPPEQEMCEVCENRLTQPAIGPLAVRLHPLTKVTFTDVRVPGYGSTGNLPFPLFSDRTFSRELGYGDVIPDELFRFLTKGKWGNTDRSVREYPTADDAQADLSDAAIAWGKWWNAQAEHMAEILTAGQSSGK